MCLLARTWVPQNSKKLANSAFQSLVKTSSSPCSNSEATLPHPTTNTATRPYPIFGRVADFYYLCSQIIIHTLNI